MKHYFTYVKAVPVILLFAVIAVSSCKKSSDNQASSAKPTVITTNISGITSSDAVSGGTISVINSSFIAEGVCWDTNPLPTVENSPASVSFNRNTSFKANITGISGGITYYVRAFLTTKDSVIYGNQVTFTSTASTIGIGNSYGGGIIFYIDNTGQHGLVVAPSDQTESIAWDNGNYINVTSDFVTSSDVGTGQANTDIIIADLGTALGTNYAAYITKGLTINGFKDWYLPSKDDLTTISANLSKEQLATFTDVGYWSSSTDATPDFLAWTVNVSGGSAILNNISGVEGVRVVRSF
jgi:hypothetical protein